jgi:hypothetical protein
MESQSTIGASTPITFTSLRGKALNGKVDSGATTSCLHATDVHAKDGKVSFNCPMLSPNNIVLDSHGTQQVSSADGGNNERPIIRLDVEIAGKPIKGMEFNLNDRSNMDEPVLIGQNIIKAGGFVIDMNVDQIANDPNIHEEPPVHEQSEPISDRDRKILEAVTILQESNVTFEELFKYIQTVNVSQLRD